VGSLVKLVKGRVMHVAQVIRSPFAFKWRLAHRALSFRIISSASIMEKGLSNSDMHRLDKILQFRTADYNPTTIDTVTLVLARWRERSS
jgi:hypothetical protein